MKLTSRSLFLAAVSFLFGCQTTEHAREADPAGFLGDYSQLREGRGEEANLIYRDPAADFGKYKKLMIDRVEIWYSSGSDLAAVPEEERTALANHLNEALRIKLSEGFEMANLPGPGVARLRVAITEAEASAPAGDTLFTIIPQLQLVDRLQSIATGTYLWAGAASIEAELLDSQSKARLAACVDRRIGGKNISGVTSSWDDVREAFDYWAARIDSRLKEWAGR